MGFELRESEFSMRLDRIQRLKVYYLDNSGKRTNMSLHNLYVENYLNHPAFENLRQPMHLDSELLDSFNLLLGSSRERASKKDFEQSKIVLKKIFDVLQTQTLDEYEVLFLQELEQEVFRYIEHEFEFRSRLKKTKISTDAGKQLGVNAFFYANLSESALHQITELARPEIEKFRARAQGGLLKRSDLSINDGPVIAKIARLLDREFRAKNIFNIVSDYVGIPYSYVGLSLELSVAGSSWWKNTIEGVVPPRTMYAHLDETIYAPKAIVYLSHVNEFNGPTTSYPKVYDEIQTNTLQDIIGRVVGEVGNRSDSPLNLHYAKSYHQSMGSKNFRQHFMSLPNSLKFNSHFGWDLLAGSPLEETIFAREVPMLGGPGKYVVFDGSRLLHRGGLIEQGERVVLQVVFWPKLPLRFEIKRRIAHFIKSYSL